MDTSTIIWIIVAVVVVLLLLGLFASIAGRKRKEWRREQAEGIRSEAAGKTGAVQDAQLKAQAAEADAQRRRAEAERAEASAAEARQGAEVERAEYEDKVRTADRLDPDVDHKASDYEPQPLGEPGHDGQTPVAEVNEASGQQPSSATAPEPDGETQAEQPPLDRDYDTRVPADPATPDDPPSTDPADPLAPREPPADGAHRA